MLPQMDLGLPRVLPTPLPEACANPSSGPSNREKRLFESNGSSFIIEIDARDLEKPLSLAGKLALYALVKRAVHGGQPGEEEFVLSQEITLGRNPRLPRCAMPVPTTSLLGWSSCPSTAAPRRSSSKKPRGILASSSSNVWRG
ncbi:hypothetical protein M885DRAFT_138105 [Pelagophyceae sp. CCMP2097]|nr:hypothetical protein M885DRAFT_138105 [Pelagophyceae sp. CCMP2097]